MGGVGRAPEATLGGTTACRTIVGVNKKVRSGRVTPKGTQPSRRTYHGGPGAVGPSAPGPSARYTPPAPQYRLRPRWHRVAGWLGIVLGIVIAAANDLMLMGDDLTLLPGGHSELYLLLGIAVAGSSTWFLGLFDRGTTVFD